MKSAKTIVNNLLFFHVSVKENFSRDCFFLSAVTQNIYSEDKQVLPMVRSSFINEPTDKKFELQLQLRSIMTFKDIFSKTTLQRASLFFILEFKKMVFFSRIIIISVHRILISQKISFVLMSSTKHILLENFQKREKDMVAFPNGGLCKINRVINRNLVLEIGKKL